MNHPWLTWKPQDVEIERQQLLDEGVDIKRLGSYADYKLDLLSTHGGINDFQHHVDSLFDTIAQHPEKTNEPSDLIGIRNLRGPYPLHLTLPATETIRDKMAGAWLGRCVGCLLGKPIEGVKRPRLQVLLDKYGYESIPDYIWKFPYLKEEDCQDFGWNDPWWYRNTSSFPGDDDTDYTVLAMAMVKKKGINFTPSDVADFWLYNMPILHTCTAERVAYRNFVDGIYPPLSATRRNPYREWIGAQIRADLYGYITPGNPEKAAELAWRDASISHVKNGIYGAMWVAAMLSVSFCENNIYTIIRAGLAQIPKTSRLHDAITEVICWYIMGLTFDKVLGKIHKAWDENNPHHWCHVIPNAQIVAASLLYSENSFDKAISNAVISCFDTDCNGATVGSIMGMILGTNGISNKLSSVMNDTIITSINGYNNTKISTISDEIFKLQTEVNNK